MDLLLVVTDEEFGILVVNDASHRVLVSSVLSHDRRAEVGFVIVLFFDSFYVLRLNQLGLLS